MKSFQKGFALVALIIILVVLASGVYVLVKKFQVESSKEEAKIEKNATAGTGNQTTADETKDWKTYHNEEYGFEFQYPRTFANPSVADKIEPNGLECLLTGSFYLQKELDLNKNTDNYIQDVLTFCVTVEKVAPDFVDVTYHLNSGRQIFFWADDEALDVGRESSLLSLISSTFKLTK